MITTQYKITLLSDIILNQKSASEGQNSTLDYIPGNCILGIAASGLYNSDRTEWPYMFELFHSGKVRFGDAHPALNNHRTCRIPLSMFHPKFEKASECCYIHHKITDFEKLADKQLKQCRGGFYDLLSLNAMQVDTLTSFALKSAHDKDKRCSKDQQMFGYESLQKGGVFYFSIEAENDKMSNDIKKAICGNKRLGRSRSAQYGLVNIEVAQGGFEEPKGLKPTHGEVAVYADSRLIFLDEFGIPTYQPSPKDFGIKDANARILWEKSQIRTFCYAPWNFQRQCYDTDRCGFEKGSVIIIKTTDSTEGKTWLGAYQTEGFGRVIYNPEFLDSTGENGKAKYHICDAIEKKQERNNVLENGGTPLLNFIKRKMNNQFTETAVYEEVNKWTQEYSRIFFGAQFASQWGNIRTIAMQNIDKAKLIEAISEYLGHGVAEDKWKKFNRRKLLINFLNEIPADRIQMTTVNLAAEMGKYCTKGGKDEN